MADARPVNYTVYNVLGQVITQYSFSGVTPVAGLQKRSIAHTDCDSQHIVSKNFVKK